MYRIAEDPIFDLEQTKYGQFLTKYIYEGHKKLKDTFEDADKKYVKKTENKPHTTRKFWMI